VKTKNRAILTEEVLNPGRRCKTKSWDAGNYNSNEAKNSGCKDVKREKKFGGITSASNLFARVFWKETSGTRSL